jgi:biopolymer transport protein ExbB
MRKALLALTLAASGLASPGAAQAWWNADWAQRTRITLNTSSLGLETKETVSQVAVAVRLHSGNFDFTTAKEDGADLRVLAADDKTPLKFSIERFDSINELAVLWVQVPSVLPGSDKNQFYIYAGNAKAAPEPGDTVAAAGFDAATLAAFHFSDKTLAGADHQGIVKPVGVVNVEANGLLAASAKLDGTAIVYPLSDKTIVDGGNQLTVSLWVRLNEVSSAGLLQWGGLKLGLKDGKLLASAGKTELSGGEVTAARWTHLALRLGLGKVTLFVGGVQVAQGDMVTPTLGNELRVGDDKASLGLLDELQLSSSLRSADWLAVTAGAQGAESKLVASQREEAGSAEGEHQGHMGILVKNLTTDAWIVIGILAIMFVIATWVTITKAVLVSRADTDNRKFLKRFRDADKDLLTLEAGGTHKHSPLFRLYKAGIFQLDKRSIGQPGAAGLSGASMNAVKASVDADFVRENAHLNSHMVLLTIAISGGPFLGLLGTVVGVMITFAAIAAAGDVNVNAIAPGIASALLATVAGLVVAIPALFAYNYLAAKIKNVASDMQIFIDEFITRVAELHGAP